MEPETRNDGKLTIFDDGDHEELEHDVHSFVTKRLITRQPF